MLAATQFAGAEMPNVLIADDQHNVLEALRLLLKTEGYRTEMVSSPGGLLQALESSDFDVVLLDLNYTRDTTSGIEGLELLSRIQALDDSLPLVVMTAWGSMELAIEAMRRGASDFIQKPWDNQQVLHTIQRQIKRRQPQPLRPHLPYLTAPYHPRIIAHPIGRVQPDLATPFQMQRLTLCIQEGCAFAGVVRGRNELMGTACGPYIYGERPQRH